MEMATATIIRNKTKSRLEGLAIRIVSELGIEIEREGNRHEDFQSCIMGSNKDYSLDYTVWNRDEGGYQLEVIKIKKRDNVNRSLSVSYIDPLVDDYLFNLQMPLEDVEAFMHFIEDCSIARGIDYEFMVNARSQLSQYLGKEEEKGCKTFVSCGVRINSEQLNQINSDLIKKYLNF